MWKRPVLFYQSILENARSWEQKRLKTVRGDDAMVNEINALTPDMILSVLPSPDQEHFLMENCVETVCRTVVWNRFLGFYKAQTGTAWKYTESDPHA
mgnify:CR=1 FL=1